MGDYKIVAAEMLKSFDDFLCAAKMDRESIERSTAVATAMCFAAEAYEQGNGNQAILALGRSFLLALVDPAHHDLDYLRASPESGEVARLMNADLAAIVENSRTKGEETSE